MQQNYPVRNPQSSISGALSAVRTGASVPMWPSIRGEDVGRSLAEMAQRDLDAALQLLADRAQFITGASGAAIALRRQGMNDMLCRASTGSNAPELGALLSTEFGLSGESVRTRQLLRCDDAERDARVNREVCRQMGIASVVVMPVVHDDEVLGVFELFSGKTNAFGERDLSAVQRLGSLVETAVRLAHVTEKLPDQLKAEGNSVRASATPEAKHEPAVEEEILEVDAAASPGNATLVPGKSRPVEPAEILDSDEPTGPDQIAAASPAAETAANVSQRAAGENPQLSPDPADAVQAPLPVKDVESATAVKRPLLWSAADTGVNANNPADADQSHVPPVLRGLRKCDACGFPISAGRVLCVECEEKQWRGQLKRPQPMPTGAIPQSSTPQRRVPVFSIAAESAAKMSAFGGGTARTDTLPSPARVAPVVEAKPANRGPMQNAHGAVESSMPERTLASAAAEGAAADLMFGAGLQDSQSWIAANKYVIGVLVVVTGLLAAFFLLR